MVRLKQPIRWSNFEIAWWWRYLRRRHFNKTPWAECCCVTATVNPASFLARVSHLVLIHLERSCSFFLYWNGVWRCITITDCHIFLYHHYKCRKQNFIRTVCSSKKMRKCLLTFWFGKPRQKANPVIYTQQCLSFITQCLCVLCAGWWNERKKGYVN
jgi:hypothetical protein